MNSNMINVEENVLIKLQEDNSINEEENYAQKDDDESKNEIFKLSK